MGGWPTDLCHEFTFIFLCVLLQANFRDPSGIGNGMTLPSSPNNWSDGIQSDIRARVTLLCPASPTQALRVQHPIKATCHFHWPAGMAAELQGGPIEPLWGNNEIVVASWSEKGKRGWVNRTAWVWKYFCGKQQISPCLDPYHLMLKNHDLELVYPEFLLSTKLDAVCKKLATWWYQSAWSSS